MVLPKKKKGRASLDWRLEPDNPLLSKMVMAIYSIRAMSSEPERVFSGGQAHGVRSA